MKKIEYGNIHKYCIVMLLVLALIFAGLATSLSNGRGDLPRYGSSILCSSRSANVLKYDHRTLIDGCINYNDNGVPYEFWDVYNHEIGDINGYSFDNMSLNITNGETTFLGNIGGKIEFDRKLNRSIAKFPAGAQGWIPGVNTILANWAGHIRDGTDGPNVPHLMTVTNVHDKQGCLVYHAEYKDFTDFSPPAIGNCTKLYG